MFVVSKLPHLLFNLATNFLEYWLIVHWLVALCQCVHESNIWQTEGQLPFYIMPMMILPCYFSRKNLFSSCSNKCDGLKVTFCRSEIFRIGDALENQMSIQEICTCECLPLPLKTTVNKIVNCANMKPLITSLICCFPL